MDRSISVILPNYNHGRYIKRAVDALLAQSLPPDEIVIVDDGSTDDSVAVIAALAAGSSRIRPIHVDANKGLVAAQNLGLSLTAGDCVYLAAADDWVLPDFFAFAMEMLARHPQCGLFTGDAVLVDGPSGHVLSTRPIVMPRFGAGAIDSGRVRRLLARGDNWILTGSSLIRRDAIVAAGGLREELGSFADGYVTRKIALTRGFCYAPRLVSTWSIFAAGVSRRTARDPDRARQLLDAATAAIAADTTFPAWYAERFARRWRFATLRLAVLQQPIDVSLLSRMAGSPFDRRLIGVLLAIPHDRLRRVLVSAWLWARLRPYRAFDLVATFLYRRLRRQKN